MKKTANISLLLSILLLSAIPVFGQEVFRIIDPNDSGDPYGKAVEAGWPFLYFGSTNQLYYIDHADYTGFEDEVEDAFDSWNDVGQVQFSESISSGVQVTAESRNPFSWGPAWMFTAFNGSTYEIDASSIPLVLNTEYTWDDNDQDLENEILDIQSMVVHEAGHVHGLAHPLTGSYTHDATAPTMAGGDNEYFFDTLEGRSLETDDIERVQSGSRLI